MTPTPQQSAAERAQEDAIRRFAEGITDGLSVQHRGKMTPCWEIPMPSDPDEAIAAIRLLQEHCEEVDISYGEAYGSGFCDIHGLNPKLTLDELKAKFRVKPEERALRSWQLIVRKSDGLVTGENKHGVWLEAGYENVTVTELTPGWVVTKKD